MRLTWVSHRRLLITPILLGFFMFSCTADHNPEEHHKAIKAERLAANQPIKRLTKEGKIPISGGEKKTSGDAKYDTLCGACHGLDGMANTPTAKALNPKPRDFTDLSWQGSVDDARIAKVIMEGGASVGLSPTMAPWGAMISQAELTKMVKTIRNFRTK